MENGQNFNSIGGNEMRADDVHVEQEHDPFSKLCHHKGIRQERESFHGPGNALEKVGLMSTTGSSGPFSGRHEDQLQHMGKQTTGIREGAPGTCHFSPSGLLPERVTLPPETTDKVADRKLQVADASTGHHSNNSSKNAEDSNREGEDKPNPDDVVSEYFMVGITKEVDIVEVTTLCRKTKLPEKDIRNLKNDFPLSEDLGFQLLHKARATLGRKMTYRTVIDKLKTVNRYAADKLCENYNLQW